MIYINAFLVVGLISMIGQIILDNTKLTPGHITSIFVVTGAILSFLGLYDYIREYSLVGSSIPIISFGNALYKGAVENGILMMLSNVSVGIVSAILMGFLMTLIFKVKD